MNDKFKIPKLEVLPETSDCTECLSQIRTHTNEVMGMFEIHADELFDKFNRTSKISLSAMEAKIQERMETHFEKQAKKEDVAIAEHFEKQDDLMREYYKNQDEKIGSVIKEAIKEMTGIIKWFLGVALIIIGAFGGLTIINTVTLASKANTNEVLSLKDAQKIIATGDAYRDQRYVLKSGETIDKYNYMWLMETIFERSSRSGNEAK